MNVAMEAAALAPELTLAIGGMALLMLGVFAGDNPSYDSVSLAAAIRPTGNVTLGATISNALDNEHYEAFGGDIIERRALGYVNYSW